MYQQSGGASQSQPNAIQVEPSQVQPIWFHNRYLIILEIQHMIRLLMFTLGGKLWQMIWLIPLICTMGTYKWPKGHQIWWDRLECPRLCQMLRRMAQPCRLPIKGLPCIKIWILERSWSYLAITWGEQQWNYVALALANKPFYQLTPEHSLPIYIYKWVQILLGGLIIEQLEIMV